MDKKKATIIAVANQKGGVGKTSTATALASGLRRNGYKTLIIDSDPQCNSTDTYQAKIENTHTLYDLFTKECTAEDAIQHTTAGDIIACDPMLRKADNEYQQQGREYLLREAIETIIYNYDFIFIDTTPSLGILLINALSAADGLIVPIVADRYSLQGLDQLHDTIIATKKYTNPQLRIMGLLVTMYQGNTKLTKDVIEILPQIESAFNAKAFSSKIRFTTKVKEASAARMPLFDYDPYCSAAVDYTLLQKELLKEVNTNG